MISVYKFDLLLLILRAFKNLKNRTFCVINILESTNQEASVLRAYLLGFSRDRYLAGPLAAA
jgi:hypothetical protein